MIPDDTTIAPDPKSADVPGSAVTVTTTVTESVFFVAWCAGCDTAHRRDDRGGALAAAAACCGAS